MKLKDLLDLVDRSAAIRVPKNEGCSVVIATSSPSVGGRRMVEITGASFGFDWEHGKFIFNLQEPVYTRTQEDEIKSLRENLDGLVWENMNLKSENKKLKNKLSKES